MSADAVSQQQCEGHPFCRGGRRYEMVQDHLGVRMTFIPCWKLPPHDGDSE